MSLPMKTAPKLTPLAALIDIRLRNTGHKGLVVYVNRATKAGESYDTIAARIGQLTGHPVTGQTIINWSNGWQS